MPEDLAAVLPPVTILDGGLGTELAARGHDLSDRLWSASLLLTDPDSIEAVHLDYFRAGANIATTASYQASIEGFVAAGLDGAEALRLIARSVELAAHARDRHRSDLEAAGVGAADDRTLLLAGSVGPYGAMLADGSEYRGDYDVSPTALAAFHRPRIEALVEAGVDLVAFETIPTIREAEVLVGLLDDVNIPAWLSFSCRDASSTSAGDPIAEAVALGSHPRVVAVGVNCTAPRHLPQLLTTAGEASDKPLIACPNGGDRWDGHTRRWVADEGGAFDAKSVASWTTLGATWLGGCCGTGPREISGLAAAVLASASPPPRP